MQIINTRATKPVLDSHFWRCFKLSENDTIARIKLNQKRIRWPNCVIQHACLTAFTCAWPELDRTCNPTTEDFQESNLRQCSFSKNQFVIIGKPLQPSSPQRGPPQFWNEAFIQLRLSLIYLVIVIILYNSCCINIDLPFNHSLTVWISESEGYRFWYLSCQRDMNLPVTHTWH